MQAVVFPSSVHGTVQAHASKSMSQRAIAAAMLARGNSTIRQVSCCDDTLAAINIARALGATIRQCGRDLLVNGGFHPSGEILNCCESGLCMRMFAPLAALHSDTLTLVGEGSLLTRPLGDMEQTLIQAGLTCTTTNGFLPVQLKGPLRGGNLSIDGSLSSQLLTGLLMALPLTAIDSVITVRNLKSKPYIDMTMELLSLFGVTVRHHEYKQFFLKGNQQYCASDYTVEGDWSGAAFLLVAGALNGSASIDNLNTHSTQSDKAITEVLRQAGAYTYTGNTCVVKKRALEAFHFDATDSPDLFPPLVALAAHCKGTSVILGASRLSHKESDRAAALQQEFGKLGVQITVQDDEMQVKGGTVGGGVVHSHHDHRIAMALATVAVAANGFVTIEDADCINKSYPAFFHDLKILNISCHYE